MNSGTPCLRALLLAGLAAVTIATTSATSAQSTNPPLSTFHYILVSGSQLLDDCECDRPPIIGPLRGGFDLRLSEENPLFSRYAVANLDLTAAIPQGTTYKLSGHGTYRIGGEVALVQEMFLELEIHDGATTKLCYLTNRADPPGRPWPMLQIHLDQTNGTPLQTYRLDLAAAPFREIWVSTTHGFHPAVPVSPTNYVTPGDLVSSAGRVVKRNDQLTAGLGFMPVVPDVGLDAVDVLSGGEIAFSMDQDLFSETLGPLHEGDVVSDHGRLVRGYAELIGAFTPEPPPADQGLDALHLLDGAGEGLLFSVRRGFFSEGLGQFIGRGDLLSSAGVVVRTNGSLLARFLPADPARDYGLDAVHVWPSGEIWFSTEETFRGPHFEPYNPGDLLSDQGYVVYRSLDLLESFAPLEDLGDFGLDSLFLVSDVALTVPGPGFTAIRTPATTGGVELEWKGAGRVFQLQRATDPAGPYLTLADIATDQFFNDTNAAPDKSFYRIQQW